MFAETRETSEEAANKPEVIEDFILALMFGCGGVSAGNSDGGTQRVNGAADS